MRRNADGTWHGEMLDGLAFVQAQVEAGARPAGARALLVGAGGAGSAIGLALLEAGVRELVVYDADPERAAGLVRRISDASSAVRTGPADPASFDMVCNATPAGMREGDALPVPAAALAPTMFVGDVITAPEITPLLQAARNAGCRTATGVEMFRIVQQLMIDFLVGEDTGASRSASDESLCPSASERS
jgi:shikimate dehydrogenase